MPVVQSVSLSAEILKNASVKLQPNGTSGDFGNYLNKALSQVSEAQTKASEVVKAFESGEEVDVTKVMLAREKASLSFEATLQVRNKLLSAYKDIISMPV